VTYSKHKETGSFKQTDRELQADLSRVLYKECDQWA